MKKKSVYLSVLLATMLVNAPEAFSQGKAKEKQVQKSDSTVIVNTKEEKKSNLMLSAESSSSPRQLNIGLPFAGDILILENDLPVVYSFWTQMPMTTWRYDNSIGRIGLMSFAEGALTFGKVGYCVTSWDRDPSSKFKGFASVYTSNYGSLKYDATVTGPIGKKGWGYMLGFNETYDRGSGTNYQFTPWGDRAEFFKAALMKKYNQGKIKLTYKYATSKTLYGVYAPLVYEGNGKTSSVDGFKLGSDSYILGSGKFPYYDYNTGASKWADLNSDSASRTLSHTIYLNGEHRFKNNMKLTYSSMYMKSKAAFTIQYPISLGVTDVDQQATTGSTAYYHGTTNPYNGPVQMIAAQYYPQVDINTSLSRIELTKKVGANDLRGGLTYQYYDAPELSYGGIYYQTVEKNPQLLDYSQYWGAVKANPLMPTAGVGAYKRTTTNRAALYFSDDIVFNKWLNGGIGARIENQRYKELHSPYANQFQNNRELVTADVNNKWNKVFAGNVVAKATKNFGFLADATYNDYYSPYWDYNQKDANGNPVSGALTSVFKDNQQSVFNVGGGIYWNHGDLFSIVSKVTHISKNNIVTSQTGYNAYGQSQMVYPIIYDINTMGWTTDVLTSPFKNFNLHFLLTLQKPQYKNYSYKVFDNTYNYNNNIIPELSKVLMEIDPSYYIFNRDVRLWVSMRYYGKQYGNPTNAFTYNGWWENFGGIDYHVSRSVDLKLQVVNFMNQSGVKGALVGGDQITDASSFVGRKIVAGGIRPRTLELTANFKF
ncbi:MAG: hypothetical protein Q8909_14580 [Bacteroidota bacterium]|nr:hypothetical protein [Bacteroidota bacterium]